MQDLSKLEGYLGYVFKNKSLLKMALTHPSFAQEPKPTDFHYQRLEFLGDSVLSLILTEHLYTLFPEEREGNLARYKAALIKGSFLAQLALQLNLPSFIQVSDAEMKSGGKNKPSILEDVFEAIIGAIFQDSHFESTRQCVLSWYQGIEHHLKNTLSSENPKGQLQEYLQKNNPNPDIKYTLIEESGPDHRKFFKVAVSVQEKILGSGKGSSKKNAEEKAALEALNSGIKGTSGIPKPTDKRL